METYQQQNEIASKDVKQYVANPINAYLLVKRLSSDWKQIETLSNTNVGIGMYSKYLETVFYIVFQVAKPLHHSETHRTYLQCEAGDRCI